MSTITIPAEFVAEAYAAVIYDLPTAGERVFHSMGSVDEGTVKLEDSQTRDIRTLERLIRLEAVLRGREGELVAHGATVPDVLDALASRHGYLDYLLGESAGREISDIRALCDRIERIATFLDEHDARRGSAATAVALDHEQRLTLKAKAFLHFEEGAKALGGRQDLDEAMAQLDFVRDLIVDLDSPGDLTVDDERRDWFTACLADCHQTREHELDILDKARAGDTGFLLGDTIEEHEKWTREYVPQLDTEIAALDVALGAAVVA